MKALLIIAALAIAFIVFANMASPPDVPVAERAKQECERMHPYDEVQSNNCRIQLMVRYLDENKKSQMDSAYQRIR